MLHDGTVMAHCLRRCMPTGGYYSLNSGNWPQNADPFTPYPVQAGVLDEEIGRNAIASRGMHRVRS